MLCFLAVKEKEKEKWKKKKYITAQMYLHYEHI